MFILELEGFIEILPVTYLQKASIKKRLLGARGVNTSGRRNHTHE